MLDFPTMNSIALNRSIDAVFKHKASLPVAMDFDDCYQEAFLTMLELNNDKPEKATKAYAETIVPHRIRDKAGSLWTGPSESTKSDLRKKGIAVSYGEVSLEQLGNSDGEQDASWQEFIASDMPTPEEILIGIEESNSTNQSDKPCFDATKKKALIHQLKKRLTSDQVIQYDQLKKKYRVDMKILGVRVFVGFYPDERKAIQEKQQFINNLLNLLAS